MISIKSILAKAAAAETKKSAAAIATELVAADKAIVYNSLRIARVGINGLYEQNIDEGGFEVSVLKDPTQQYFAIHLNGEVLAGTDGSTRTYIFISLYELLGVLKQSPMAAFANTVANNPKLAAVLLPGAAIDVCAEVAEAGDYVNPFGKDGNHSTLKTDKVIHHIISLGSSPAAKAAMAAQAEKLAQF